MRLWRWLCCLTGHHRETVVERDGLQSGEGHGFRWTAYRRQMVLRCLDCPHTRTLATDTVFTPSRRYALKRQERAA